MDDDDNPGSAETVASSVDTLAPAARDHSAPPSLLADRYEVLALLGVGGMGRVYRVHDRALDETVALKLLRRELVGAPDMVERFRREVKLARKVTSPHVVRTFDLGQHEDEYFLTMEYVEGRSLANLLEDGPLAIDEVVRIARAACAGLVAAHAAGVLHRDLKPDNILVATDGRIAITDFGIARAQTPGPTSGATETLERFVGTPAYMAPEQVDGVAPIGPATDVYAFGAIIFEMLANRRAFIGDDPIRVAIARLTAEPPDPRAHRSVPDALADLVLRCLARDPSQRFADGAQLAAALAALAMSSVGATLPQAMIPVVPTKGSRSVAVLPLRTSSPELADLADGLSEEIVDALTLTRALRVRPLASVRGRTETDPRAIGQALGVDVVVEGSLRKIGELVRITARAIGVADGFQLSADRVDARPDALLAAGDAIAQAVARALTVELAMPARRATDPRATELFLEGKAKVRTAWMLGPIRPALVALEAALALAPDDPSVIAALAIASAREAFFGSAAELARARTLADRAVLLAPNDGEAWLALGLACLYAGEMPTAGAALYRAVVRAPGLAMAQAALGATLLEAGAIAEGNAHLEAALALDPTASLARWDLSRGLVYAGRFDAAVALLDAFEGDRAYADITLGRFRMWRGERFDAKLVRPAPGTYRPDLFSYAEAAFGFYRTGRFEGDQLEQLLATVVAPNPRLRATRAQFAIEFLIAIGDRERAFDYLKISLDAGLYDTLWIERCPLLDPMRADPRFADAAKVVTARAAAILTAIQSSR